VEIKSEHSGTECPPRLADALLRYFHSVSSQEEILGDIHELFDKRRRKRGLWQARILYWWDVICFFNPDMFINQSKGDDDHPYQAQNDIDFKTAKVENDYACPSESM